MIDIETNVKIENKLEKIYIQNELFFKIGQVQQMRPFFMSIVSHSDHWMFVSSTGGITMGRKNAENALFPYYTDDKIEKSFEDTGSKTIIKVFNSEESVHFWEPFSEKNKHPYQIVRNIYKNKYGNKLILEEENQTLGITYSYQWSFTQELGFIKKSMIFNRNNQSCDIEILDGIQNIIPYGVGSELQNRSSNLVNAYKRNELESSVGLGIYTLSAIIVDKAIPSEALKANVVWSVNANTTNYLLSSLQLNSFRRGESIKTEKDIKAEPGAYFIHTRKNIKPNSESLWYIISDVNYDYTKVVERINALKNKTPNAAAIEKYMEVDTQELIKLNASSDALQATADKLRDARHYSNTLFNIMRGGIFDNNYQIEKKDFSLYLKQANIQVFNKFKKWIETLPEIFTLFEIHKRINQQQNLSIIRLGIEYLPLKFSRRHGDPSRPWNKFSINIQNNDGSKKLDYEGNWRDIFQNWEALACSFPYFLEGMITKFLNASTFDGYNPYRITKNGIDWEIDDPDDAWSYIGYWGDHQIIYLLKFLELLKKHQPQNLMALFDKNIYVYAHVPYKIKSFQEIVANPKDTIIFDDELHENLLKFKTKIGSDGVLMRDRNNLIIQVNFVEKILATLLAKISNFIPHGGIWMNTQRPEWNDANNALVGNGVSMVTLYYLRRFINFFLQLTKSELDKKVGISKEIYHYFNTVLETLDLYSNSVKNKLSSHEIGQILEKLGTAGSNYRALIYSQSFTGEKTEISLGELNSFLQTSLSYLDDSIRVNKREDGLFHAYNLLSFTHDNKEVKIAHLTEMLEGQVAVLSSGKLTTKESLNLLDALKNSSLFREDQYSYILYPNKGLPGFLSKNIIPDESIKKSPLLTKLIEKQNRDIVSKDLNGACHFNGSFTNSSDLEIALNTLSESDFKIEIQKEKKAILSLYETIFNHKAFTGRSGTFFGYEGLGSIYWHMVSKLQLAVQECCLTAINQNQNPEIIEKLFEHYYEINEGIGVHKPPQLYGAFPTDPYSHTPAGKGAQQPGMTGQVKEDILSRFGELGIVVNDGKLAFKPYMLRKNEFLKNARTILYVDINNEIQTLHLNENNLAFTYCQVPIIYILDDENKINITDSKGAEFEIKGEELDSKWSQYIFKRNGIVSQIYVHINQNHLI